MAGFVDLASGGDAHALTDLLDRQNLFAGSDIGTGRGGKPQMSADAGFCVHKAGVRLDHRDIILRQPERGIASHQVVCGEHLMRKLVLLRRRERARHQRGVRPPDFGDAGDRHQRASGRRFEFAPHRGGAADQRHVGGMLEIAVPDDTRAAMRGAAFVAGLEALQSNGADIAARKMIERSAAHGAKPDHNHVMRHIRLPESALP